LQHDHHRLWRFFVDTISTSPHNFLVRLARNFSRLRELTPARERMAAGGWDLMSFLPGSTVQCINPNCEARGRWVRAEQVSSERCPSCGESLRHVRPPLAPRHHFRPRPVAPRPPLRPH
jgi:hypothetical protein